MLRMPNKSRRKVYIVFLILEDIATQRGQALAGPGLRTLPMLSCSATVEATSQALCD